MELKDLCVESTLYSVHWSTLGFVHWCCTGFIDFQVQRVEIVNTSRARDVDVTFLLIYMDCSFSSCGTLSLGHVHLGYV